MSIQSIIDRLNQGGDMLTIQRDMYNLATDTTAMLSDTQRGKLNYLSSKPNTTKDEMIHILMSPDSDSIPHPQSSHNICIEPVIKMVTNTSYKWFIVFSDSDAIRPISIDNSTYTNLTSAQTAALTYCNSINTGNDEKQLLQLGTLRWLSQLDGVHNCRADILNLNNKYYVIVSQSSDGDSHPDFKNIQTIKFTTRITTFNVDTTIDPNWIARGVTNHNDKTLFYIVYKLKTSINTHLQTELQKILCS